MKYISAAAMKILMIGFLVSHSTAALLRGNEERNETISLKDRTVLGEMPSFDYDVELVAKTFDWSPEDTRKHMALQKAFSSLVGRLEKYDNFADSEMAMNPGDCPTIYFKGNLPDDIKREVEILKKRSHVEVRTLVTKFSRAEQEKRAEMISDLLNQKGFTNVGYSLGPGDALVVNAAPPEGRGYKDTPDPGTDEVDLSIIDEVAKEILTEPNDDVDRDPYSLKKVPVGKVPIKKEVKDPTVAPNTADGYLYGLRLILSSGDGGETDFHTRGGRKIRSNTHQCTTGFTVIKSDGHTTGVTTAAHCTGMNKYDAEPPESDYATYWKGQHNGAWGDFEWHTTSHIEPPEYWASPTQKRFVYNIDTSFSKNDVVCGYSRRGGFRFCDRIYRTSVKQGGTKRLVAMRNRNMQGGDSGGPWSFGTTASGLVKGAKVIWFKWRDTWSRAAYISIGLPGMIVRTK